MDEYYCPNCGATLNDQFGFNPNQGTWTCAECGQRVMDDDVYCGNAFEGVEWRCDSCNALLNRQYGFSDTCGTWNCTECGHCNSIKEEEIVDGEELIRCPNCDGVLNKQLWYSEYCNDWECTFCGTKLHRDCTFDDYSIITNKGKGEKYIECPNCGDDLTKQWNFDKYEDDWVCTECDAKLHHDCSDDEYEIIEEDEYIKNVGEDCEDDDVFCDLSREHNDNRSKKTISSQQHLYLRPNKELRKTRVKAFVFNHKKIQIGFDCTDFFGKNVFEVRVNLHNRAFNNIKAIPVYDIYVDSKYKEGEIEQVVIGGKSFFEASDFIPYDEEIIITYHKKKRITIPFSRQSMIRKNYVFVGDKFQELGFTKIYERPIKDLLTGWITKNGSVEKIYIANSDSFKKKSSYEYDVEIVIEYHTFQKERV